MSDPYHTYDKHNIQINVFHIKEPLKGDNKNQRNKNKHKEAYIFNIQDKEDINIDFPETDIKLIKDRIYLSDTIEIVYRKISKILDLSSNEIYAWIDEKPERKLFEYSKSLGIHYNDLENCKYMNPFLEKEIDDRFVNSDGSIKRNSLTYLDRYKILNSQFIDNNYNIYFTTLSDLKEYSENNFKEIDFIENGFLRKYFPLMNEKNNDKEIDKKIEIIEKQKNILNEYEEIPIDIRPIHLIYENKDDKNIIIDLFKIFQDFELSLNVPMIKIQTDNYINSYIKFYKDGINNSYKLSKDKNITNDLFERWNKNIYLSDGFSRPKSIDKKNSLTFILYDNVLCNFIQMIIYINGKVKIYSERFQQINKFTNETIQKYLRKANNILREINKDLIVNIPLIISDIKTHGYLPTRIDISIIYEISDYHLLSLKKLFNSFYTEFIVLNDDNDKLHLLYSKCDDFENMKYLSDTITLCKRKKIIDKDIIEILNNRYGLNKTKSKEYLDEWLSINSNKPIRYREEIKNISIIIEKVLDRIKVSFYDLYNYSSFHECIDMINRIMNVYKLKRIDKRKDLPEDIEKLFKKTGKNIIITSQPEIKVDEQELEIQEDISEDTSEEQNKDKDKVLEHTDEILESDSDNGSGSGSGSGSDSEDEYEDIDDDLLARMKGGSLSFENNESKYPNSRYYIKRLEMKDPRLIKYKAKSSRDGYSAKCQAAQDKQPIALTRDELLEIDRKVPLSDEQERRREEKYGSNKPEFKHEGISYSNPIKILGSDRDDIYYICPKFWDRKYQIPIDPISKYHPIEKDDEGNPIEWKGFVWKKEYKNSDGDYFILERSGRASGKLDSSSYWNKDKEKDNIDRYQVQLIHDDVHPELLALPCCGKKPYGIKKKEVNVIINKNGKNKWVIGDIVDENERKRLNNEGICKIKYEVEDKEKGEIIKKIGSFHISQIKERKGHTQINSHVFDYTEFPLKEKTFGQLNTIIKNIFFMRPNSPNIKLNSTFGPKGKNIKREFNMEDNGFFRVGVKQDSNAFLNSINILSVYYHIENKKDGRNYMDFYSNLLKDFNNLSNEDILNIGNGSFYQYFRNDENEIYNPDRSENTKIKNLKKKFEKYLSSDEPKDDKLLIPLLMKCSEKSNNILFNKTKINILILSETYEKRGEEIINTKIKLLEPYGGLNIYENAPFFMIYKKDDYYEPILYYYNFSIYSSISNIKDDSELKKGDIIYISNETAVIQNKEINDNIKIKYENGLVSHISKDDCIKYDRSIIYKILNEFIYNCKSKAIYNKKEIISFEDINFIMSERLNYKIIEGYYDNYNKLVCILYEKISENESLNKGLLKKIPIFIKPRKKNDIDFPLKRISKLKKFQLNRIIIDYKNLDNHINEIYPDKYLMYITDKCKVIMNNNKFSIGFFMENGFIIPLIEKKYTEGYENIICESILSLQMNNIDIERHKDKTDDYFNNYNENKNNIYKTFTNLYDNIIRNNKLKTILQKIINHPIMLNIHKRIKLYDLLKDIYKEKDNKNLKIFIEYLLIHDLKDLQKILFQNYSSLKDYKINYRSNDTIILTMKEFLTGSYLDLFEKYSEYIRNISYYEYSNPNINKLLLKKEYIEKPVSSYSKYPNTLMKYFGKNITIYKNIISENRNDIDVICSIYNNINTNNIINNQNIKDHLIHNYNEDDDSYKNHNKILKNKYKDNRELISNINEKFYKLTLIDYELLSEILKVGFVLFSNRYSNENNIYKPYIRIHKSLKDDNEMNIQMICLYEDISGDIIDNTECKSISINGKLSIKIEDLFKYKEFKKIYKRS